MRRSVIPLHEDWISGITLVRFRLLQARTTTTRRKRSAELGRLRDDPAMVRPILNENATKGPAVGQPSVAGGREPSWARHD